MHNRVSWWSVTKMKVLCLSVSEVIIIAIMMIINIMIIVVVVNIVKAVIACACLISMPAFPQLA